MLNLTLITIIVKLPPPPSPFCYIVVNASDINQLLRIENESLRAKVLTSKIFQLN